MSSVATFQQTLEFLFNAFWDVQWRAQGILQVFRVFLYFSRYFQCTGTFCKVFFISSNPRKKWFWRSWNLKGRRIFTRLCDFLENWNYGWWIFPSLSLVFLFWRFTDWYSILAVQTTRQPPTTFFSLQKSSILIWDLYIVCMLYYLHVYTKWFILLTLTKRGAVYTPICQLLNSILIRMNDFDKVCCSSTTSTI